MPRERVSSSHVDAYQICEKFLWLKLPPLLPLMSPFECAPTPPDHDSRPSRPAKARKKAGRRKEIKKKKAREIEYIRVPKHWFSDPLHHHMKTVVRPPTKRTRRKVQLIECKVPQDIFVDLMQPMDDGDMKDFAWEDETNRM